MPKSKLTLAVLFGGASAEHEISLISASNIIKKINRQKYNLVFIGISRNGQWALYNEATVFKHLDNAAKTCLGTALAPVVLMADGKNCVLINLKTPAKKQIIDIVFPILHGPNCEDGALQGLLKLTGVPFVGCGVLSSAICMDKEVSKRLLRDAGLNIAQFLTYELHEKSAISFAKAKKALGLPIFVKPANLGSSIGISKVNKEKEFARAINLAFKYDKKILLEQAIIGREIECAILGNSQPVSSLPGEICPPENFYTFDSKYLDNTTKLFAPAPNLGKNLIKQLQNIAILAYKALCCQGFARVDMFLTPEKKIYINEINTIPGFTGISMYPKLWEITGLSQEELIEQLIVMCQ